MYDSTTYLTRRRNNITDAAAAMAPNCRKQVCSQTAEPISSTAELFQKADSTAEQGIYVNMLAAGIDEALGAANRQRFHSQFEPSIVLARFRTTRDASIQAMALKLDNEPAHGLDVDRSRIIPGKNETVSHKR